MKILVIQLRQLGDIILTTPVIRALKSRYPEAQISFLAHPMGKLILADNPLLHEALYVPTSGLVAQMKFALDLRSRKFDLVFDFMGNPRSAFLTKLTGAKRRLGFQSARAWAYTQTAPRISGTDYIVQEKFRLLAVDGIKGTDQRTMLPWFDRDFEHVTNWMKSESALANAPFRVALSPTHRREGRRWSAERWVALADWLTLGWGAGVVWLWGPGEEEFVSAVQKQCRERTWMSPKTSFRELAALTAQCELFVGGSNGPSHVAVAVNTPSLQLHGPTDAPSWCPMTERHQAVIEKSMADISLTAVQQKLMAMRPLLAREISRRGQVSNSDTVWKIRPNL